MGKGPNHGDSLAYRRKFWLPIDCVDGADAAFFFCCKVTMNVDRHEEVDEKDSWDVKRPSGRPSPTKAGSVEDC